MAEEKIALESLTPKQIVEKLDTYIIGQHKAKKSVAIALRNRTRRLKLPEEISEEIAPKNILMIGPTGVGKTEIARRLAKLCGAPFLKVEATKYTEVGYVGRDVESMIRDLMGVAINMVKAESQEKLKAEAEKKVEEQLLDLLLPGSGKSEEKETDNKTNKITLPNWNTGGAIKLNGETLSLDNPQADTAEKIEKKTETEKPSQDKATLLETREKFRTMLREGKLEEREVELNITKSKKMPAMEMFVGTGNIDDIEQAMQSISSALSGPKTKRKTVTVSEARKILLDEMLENMVDTEKVTDEAKRRVEQMGIIFIDEIDKIACQDSGGRGADVSRQGVQRDILPIVEGSNVNTRYGVIDTTHILFIAAGAFNLSKPSDLIPELQGRFPLRVELESLNAEDFKRILLEPKNALTRQYKELLATEGVTVIFSDEAINRMSYLAAEVNSRNENIGARRLHTIMETLLEDLSFSADELSGQTITITPEYVDEKLANLVENQDLSKYIL
jgi:ATP-dependent HslUV protease ATP-binding subunit HslU